MGRRTWRATVHRVAQSQMQLKQLSTHTVSIPALQIGLSGPFARLPIYAFVYNIYFSLLTYLILYDSLKEKNKYCISLNLLCSPQC